MTPAACCRTPRTSPRCASCGENSFTTTSRPGATCAEYVAVAPAVPEERADGVLARDDLTRGRVRGAVTATPGVGGRARSTRPTRRSSCPRRSCRRRARSRRRGSTCWSGSSAPKTSTGPFFIAFVTSSACQSDSSSAAGLALLQRARPDDACASASVTPRRFTSASNACSRFASVVFASGQPPKVVIATMASSCVVTVASSCCAYAHPFGMTTLKPDCRMRATAWPVHASLERLALGRRGRRRRGWRRRHGHRWRRRRWQAGAGGCSRPGKVRPRRGAR